MAALHKRRRGPRHIRRYPVTGEDVDNARDRAVLVGVDLGRTDWPIDESLAELERLAETSGAEVVGLVTQRLDRPNPRTFIGAGKAEEVVRVAAEQQAGVVIFDDDLTPSQQANIEKLMPETKVLDRTALILDIFAQHAVTREGKLQVELATLEYVLPRLRGMWGHLEAERLGGGRGARFGAGESQLETDRRLTRRRIGELKRELKHVTGERNLQRKARSRSGVFRLALVGYTNAGKSTLLNALTDAGVLVEDMLFATLDSTTRQLKLPEGRSVTVTDTVGFINKLPHGLVEAFKSTLDEVREADLLLQLVDASHVQRTGQMRAVAEVLGELDAAAKPMVTVYNKIDLLPQPEVERLRSRYPSAVFISAAGDTGIDDLLDRIGAEASRASRDMTLLVPFDRGDIVRSAHEYAQVISTEHTAEGTALVVKVPAELADRFAAFQVASGDEVPAASGDGAADPASGSAEDPPRS